MSIIKCLECENSYSDTLFSCPHCGYTPTVFICKSCGEIIGKDYSTCLMCGDSVHGSIPNKPSDVDYTLSKVNSYAGVIEESTDIEEIKRMQKLIASTESQIDINEVMQSAKKKLNELSSAKETEKRYQAGIRQLENKNYAQAIRIFEKLGDYLDSEEKAALCANEVKKAEQKKKKKGNVIILSICSVALVTAVVLLIILKIVPEKHYNKAQEYYDSGDYLLAEEEFTVAGKYGDSEKMAVLSHKAALYQDAETALASLDYAAAVSLFKEAGDYMDSGERALSACSDWADYAFANEDYETAYRLYLDMEDSSNKRIECGKGLIEQGNYELALEVFTPISNSYTAYTEALLALENEEYLDAIDALARANNIDGALSLQDEAYYGQAEKYMEEGEYGKASVYYGNAGRYLDAPEKKKEADYQKGIKFFNQKKYIDAFEVFRSLAEYKDSQEYYDNSELMYAEKLYNDGCLNEAEIHFENQTGREYDNVSADARLETLNKYSAFVEVCGDWKASHGYMQTKDITGGYSTGWNIDSDDYRRILTDCSVHIQCHIENDTVRMCVTYSYFRYTNFSVVADLLNRELRENYVEIDNLTSFGSSINLSDYETLRFSNGELYIDYLQTATPVAYSKEEYKSNYTYVHE